MNLPASPPVALKTTSPDPFGLISRSLPSNVPKYSAKRYLEVIEWAPTIPGSLPATSEANLRYPISVISILRP